jgi:predicted ester cyclase
VDCIIHYPGGDDVIGLEAIKERVAATYKAFPDLHYELEEPIIAEEDKVAFCYELTGTNQESLMGIPPTGEKVSFKGLTIYRFSEGITKEVWVQYNSLGLMQQLGMELKPKEGKK